MTSKAARHGIIAGVSLALLVAAPAWGRETVGVFESWGAFADSAPRRCYAIAQPVQSGGSSRWRPFASVADWPGQGARNQLHLRLSRARDPRARVTLSIGERRFELVAGEADAWAPDARADAAIVAAIRSGRSMSVETLAKSGGPFADVYALGGAATAIDAAALACVRR
ncbi:hypothetical protein AWL63_02710 [Sphingomonas panacis]|uniref:Uncharacterized protein n=1 Tax=Sphingomonas panacis TaxID=1560345 RepID=A0A1B3Z6J9_9SPHN|nr:hypothetical protein [Sphingomonas panacis]AOH83047.1 hypothetical protein AWL63_02710 [Sphingomonas panacis]